MYLLILINYNSNLKNTIIHKHGGQGINNVEYNLYYLLKCFITLIVVGILGGFTKEVGLWRRHCYHIYKRQIARGSESGVREVLSVQCLLV